MLELLDLMETLYVIQICKPDIRPNIFSANSLLCMTNNQVYCFIMLIYFILCSFYNAVFYFYLFSFLLVLNTLYLY